VILCVVTSEKSLDAVLVVVVKLKLVLELSMVLKLLSFKLVITLVFVSKEAVWLLLIVLATLIVLRNLLVYSVGLLLLEVRYEFEQLIVASF
jgi:hypothetical protein